MGRHLSGTLRRPPDSACFPRSVDRQNPLDIWGFSTLVLPPSRNFLTASRKSAASHDDLVVLKPQPFGGSDSETCIDAGVACIWSNACNCPDHAPRPTAARWASECTPRRKTAAGRSPAGHGPARSKASAGCATARNAATGRQAPDWWSPAGCSPSGHAATRSEASAGCAAAGYASPWSEAADWRSSAGRSPSRHAASRSEASAGRSPSGHAASRSEASARCAASGHAASWSEASSPGKPATAQAAGRLMQLFNGPEQVLLNG